MIRSTSPAANDTAPSFRRTRASLYVLLAILLLMFEISQIWSGVRNVQRWRNLEDDGRIVNAEVTSWWQANEADDYEVWIAFVDEDAVEYSGRVFVSEIEAADWEIEFAATLPVIYHPDTPWLVYRLVDADDPPLIWQAFLTTNPDATWWGTVVVFVIGYNAVLVYWVWRARRLWRERWRTKKDQMDTV